MSDAGSLIFMGWRASGVVLETGVNVLHSGRETGLLNVLRKYLDSGECHSNISPGCAIFLASA